jgi:deoxyribonuclease V
MNTELSSLHEPTQTLPSYQDGGKILITDVDYRDSEAVVAGIVLDSWRSETHEVITCHIPIQSEYEPGAFYKRELPCLLELLKHVKGPLSCIVVDGYVHLGEEERPGLGQHLYRSLNGTIPVIGVAKTYFNGTREEYCIYRGDSKKPLYVTATGIELRDAKDSITSMHGPYRIPSGLKLADQACRTATNSTA